MKKTRSVICTLVGHVDHGKSSILDKIRGTAIVKSEAGGITQAIGASIIPLEVIKQICGSMLDQMKLDFTIPGLLFIDTPGHAAFSNLRKRGGNLADIAILVIDINEGFKPQTIEAIQILKNRKTPFIVAANKVDKIQGWQKNKDSVVANIGTQTQTVQQMFETKLYGLVGSISEQGVNSERFDRVDDFTKQIAVVPCSAHTGEGIPELLMMIAGLAQRYLEDSLQYTVEGAARGTILEVKRDRGLGLTMDAIIYDGILKKNDIIVVGTLDKPIVTRVKALFEPSTLSDMRDKKTKFIAVPEVSAATGVKISALDIENVVAGVPFRSVKENVDKAVEEVKAEVDQVVFETNKEGLVVKADTLGSLEALISLLKDKSIPVRTATIGDISRKDLIDAQSNLEKNPLNSVVLGFNVGCSDEIKEAAKDRDVCVITDAVIYALIDNYEKWKQEKSDQLKSSAVSGLPKPCKVKLLQGYVFRQNNPAIVGSEVMAGTLQANAKLFKNKNIQTQVKQIQLESKAISAAEKNSQVAVAYDGVTVGRQIFENDVLYSDLTEEVFRKYKDMKDTLTQDEVDVLKEIAQIKREENPMWGV